MADDPFAGYKPPSQAQGADPFAGYSAPASSSSASPDPGADESWSSYLLRHLASANQTLSDATRTAQYAMTGGLIDKAFGPQAQADAAAASQRLGPVGSTAASVAGYMAGPGELKGAQAIGEAAAPYIGQRLGGMLGTGAEGAIASGVGAYGDQKGWTPDVGAIAKASAIGGGLGAATGVLGGVVGRPASGAVRGQPGPGLPPAQTPAALEAAKTVAYTPLDAGVFHGPSQVAPALDAVTSTMTGAEQDLAKSTMAKVEKLKDQSLVTGSDIQSYQKIFDGLGRTGSDTDREFAPQFSDALEGIMQKTTPYGRNMTPGQGMSLMLPGQLGGTGLAAGDMAAARDAGDQIFGRLQDVQRLANFQKAASVAGGPDVGGQARSYLLSNEGQRLAPPGSPQYGAYNTLAGTSAAPSVSGVPSIWDVRHLLHPIAGPLIEGAIVGASGQAAEGHFDPAHFAEEVALGGLLGYGVHKGVPAAYGKFLQGPAQQRAIDAARVALSTGQAQSPLLRNAPTRNALANLLFSQGAAGNY